MNFRTLNYDEIDVRVSTANPEKGASYLLYKDARCDMNILDETVGPMNWERRHTRDNANCTVSIWDAEKQQWISKEDTGTESNTEAEKGLASDSFKRACFNWGIGRELYSAPFIYIKADKLEWRKNPRTGKEEPCSKLKVRKIGYDDKRRINLLVISSDKGVVYEYYNNIEGVENAENKPKKADKKAIVCPVCGNPVKDVTTKNGKTKTAAEILEKLGMCYDCYSKQGAQP